MKKAVTKNKNTQSKLLVNYGLHTHVFPPITKLEQLVYD